MQTTPMTNQDIFEAVGKHLLTMERQSTDYQGSCVYRTEGGDRCAIGALIPDELYNPKMDKITACAVRDFFTKEEVYYLGDIVAKSIGYESREDVDEETYELMGDLQSIHDSADMTYFTDPEKVKFLKYLKQVAETNNLNFKPLEEYFNNYVRI